MFAGNKKNSNISINRNDSIRETRNETFKDNSNKNNDEVIN